MAGQERKKPVRLDRLLAQEGLGTRSELKKQIRDGKASVNERVEKDPGRQIFPEDRVVFNGKKVGQAEHVYYMLNKPAGVITATEDRRERTVLDLLRDKGVLRRDLFPVGRVDKDTEGLLLVTDDGELAHRLLSPGRYVDKTYYAVVTGHVSQEEIRLFREGLYVDEELTAMPSVLEVITEDHPDADGRDEPVPGGAEKDAVSGCAFLPGAVIRDPAMSGAETDAACERDDFRDRVIGDSERVLVTIQEGKYHQVKRMFGAVGRKVLYLRRISMGPLRLDKSLAPGEFRELADEEIEALRGAV